MSCNVIECSDKNINKGRKKERKKKEEKRKKKKERLKAVISADSSVD